MGNRLSFRASSKSFGSGWLADVAGLPRVVRQQLYRQTITGGSDVLQRLDAAERGKVSVLPFHGWCKPTDQKSIVVEGFPGWTLKRMGLTPTGYKHSTSLAREKRSGIIEVLCRSGIPIREEDINRAVADNEGDAVDALVLLGAATCTQNRVHSD